MAEPDDTALDSRLRDALGRAARPGDSAGVADAIRSRLAAGDPGTPVAGPVAPGWGRRLFGGLLGAIILGVVLVGGTAVGVGVALTGGGGERTAVPTMPAAPTPSPTPTVTPTATAEPAPGPTAIPVPEPLPVPAPPVPAADTTAPTVQASSSAAMLYAANGSSTTITAIAEDAVGVAQVTIVWSGFASGSAAMTPSGGVWTYLFTLPPGPPGSGQIDVVVTALDAAGNAASTTVSVPVTP